jgi:hypothetical protein
MCMMLLFGVAPSRQLSRASHSLALHNTTWIVSNAASHCCPFLQDLAQQATFVDLNTPYCIYCCTNEQPMPEVFEPAACGPSFAPSSAAAAAGGWTERRMFTRLSARLASNCMATGAGTGAKAGNEKGSRCILEPLLACSTCPASFHPSCYLEGAGEEVSALATRAALLGTALSQTGDVRRLHSAVLRTPPCWLTTK